MQKILLILITLLQLKYAGQTPAYSWVKGIGGSGTDRSAAMALSGAGFSYITGSFQGVVDFNPGPGVNTITATGSDDAFILRIDVQGNFVWVKSIGAQTGSVECTSIKVDGSGNVYVTGTFSGTVDFDPGIGISNLTSAGLSDLFILKLDINGAFSWVKNVGGISDEIGKFVELDASGNVFVTGMFSGTADFNPGAGSFLMTPVGDSDVFILKLSNMGNFVWAKQFGGNMADCGNVISLDASGNIYTNGFFKGTADFDPGAGVFNLTSFGQADIFITKLDASGNFVWAKQAGGAMDDVGNALVVDASGNVSSTGFFEGAADFDPGAAVSNLTSSGDKDIYILKLSATGNFIWAKSVGSSSADQGRALATDGASNIYTTGFFSGPADFDPGSGVSTLNPSGMFILELNAAGNFVWARQIGSPATTYGTGIGVSLFGTIFSTGNFSGAGDFDPDAGTASLTSTGTDFFVHKFAACGAPAPPVNITPATNTIVCDGNPITLFVSSGDNVNWFPNYTSSSIIWGGLVYSTGSLPVGSYTFYAQASSTCSTVSDRTPVPFKVTVKPNVVINGSIPVLCEGNSATLTCSGASTYSWSTGISANAIVVSPTVTTTYSVSGSNVNTCTNTVSYIQIVNACTAIPEENSIAALLIYPNPSDGLIAIKSVKATEITIIDIYGKIIFSGALLPGRNVIDLNTQPNGMYLIQSANSHYRIIKR